MSDPLMTDPRRDAPRFSDRSSTDYNYAADRANSSWGWLAGIAVVVVVLALIYGFSHTGGPGDRTGAINTPPASTSTPSTAPANRPASPMTPTTPTTPTPKQ